MAGMESSLDLSGVLSKEELGVFLEHVESMQDDPNEAKDPLAQALYSVATGSHSGRRPKDEGDDDETYNALRNGGADNCITFCIDGDQYLRFGQTMRISEEHSSVAEPVGMVRDALNTPVSAS